MLCVLVHKLLYLCIPKILLECYSVQCRYPVPQDVYANLVCRGSPLISGISFIPLKYNFYLLFIITVLCSVEYLVADSHLTSVYRFRFCKKISRKKSQVEEKTELCPVFNIFVFFYPSFYGNHLTQPDLCYRPLYPQRWLFCLFSN